MKVVPDAALQREATVHLIRSELAPDDAIRLAVPLIIPRRMDNDLVWRRGQFDIIGPEAGKCDIHFKLIGTFLHFRR